MQCYRQTQIGQFARFSGYTQHLSLGWTVHCTVNVGVCRRLRNVAVNPFCSFLWLLPRYIWLLPSFNKQALCAISTSYQPVTLYGEDKSRQLKFKLPCALPWLPSFRVSPHLSLAPGRTASVLCQRQKERRATTLVKHRYISLCGES